MTAQRRPRKTFSSRLQDELASTQPEYRGSIERLIEAGGTSPRAVAAILQDAKRPSELRQTAVYLLSDLAPKKALQPLLAVAADTTAASELRQECARRAGWQLGDKRALPVLLELMQKDPDPRVREAAAYGLWVIDDARDEVTEPLLQTLRNREEEPAVRAQAAETLGELWYLVEGEEPPIVDDLVAALEDPSEVVRFWAAFALSKVGDERVFPALENLAATDDRVLPGWWSVKHEALMAIARMLDERGSAAQAEAMYRRVLADDLKHVPLLRFDVLDDLARLLRKQAGREAEAEELERQASEVRQGFRADSL